MSEQQIEERVERAKQLFHQGFNCSQSVFAACADIYGIDDQDLALRMSASFGGGIGRMRMACGAACGMFLLAGLETGSATPGDADGKKRNYDYVQQLAAEFRQENGSLICAELLGLANPANEASAALACSHTDTTPAPRTEEYYHKRPCVELVASAVRMYLSHIE